MNPTIEQDAGVFFGLVTRYFEVVGGSAPEFLAPSLEWQSPPRLGLNGYMAVAGAFEGWVAFSLPQTMVAGLLTALGETVHDEATFLDLVAEMTGVITSNARAHFGERLRVSPPVATRDNALPAGLLPPPVALKLPFRWQGEEAFLLLALAA